MNSRLLLWITLVLSILLFCTYSFFKIPKLTQGFAAYYTFSRMLAEGDDLSRSYDFDYFNSKIAQYSFNNILDMPNNLPTNSFVLVFLSGLEPQTAKIIWGIISILFLAASVWMLLKLFEIKFTENAWLIFPAFFFLFYPVYSNIALGQIYLLLLFLFTFVMYLLRSGKKIPAAAIHSFAFLIKGYGALIPVWYLIRKNIKSFIAFVVISLAIFLISIPILGFNTWVSFYKIIPTVFLQSPSSSNVAYQTLGGFIKHLFVFDEKWNPFPAVSLPQSAGFILSAAVNAVFIIWVFIRIKDIKNDNILIMVSFSSVLGLSVITAPMAEEYHYILFLPLIIGLGKILFTSFQSPLLPVIKIYRIIYIISAAVLAAPLNYKSLQNAKFPLIILAYPKLYAGITLTILFLILIKKLHQVPKPAV